MNLTISKFGIAFYLIVLLSPFARKYISFADSNTFGIFIGILILYFLFYKTLFTLKIDKGFIILILALVSYSFIPPIFNIDFEFSKYLVSLLFFIFFIIGAILFSNIVEKVSDKKFDKIISSVFFVLLSDGLISSLVQIFIDDRDFIFFREPSHFAMVVLPFLFYKVAVSSNKHGALYIFVFFCIGAIMKSLTLIAGLIIIAFVIYGLRTFILFFTIFLLMIGFVPDSKLEYYKSRMDIVNAKEIRSQTLLVFLSGYEEAFLNTVDTNLLGIGFQQVGFKENLGEFRKILAIHGWEHTNKYGGGFLGGKLVTEFGILGLFLILAYIYGILVIRASLLFSPEQGERNRRIFFSAIYIMFSVELLLKGTGYFTSTTFLFLAGCIFLFSLRNKKYVSSNYIKS